MRLIDDWLFNRKRKKEIWEEFQQMEEEYASVDLKEGQITGDGGVRCPHCSYALTQIEYLEQFQPGAVRILECPKCHGQFKSH